MENALEPMTKPTIDNKTATVKPKKDKSTGKQLAEGAAMAIMLVPM